ncbi:diguanylate phosphodiesterase [Klebsiella pneumoniae]|uniref:Diguanylate phosphodiesterase n=1 Tax=Klebsiella pneumoniae TaxID=573 RepID=A0A378A8N5_KLEPN|nr:diguanylate phosphodiesterase [Klebsiella pneumoniae]
MIISLTRHLFGLIAADVKAWQVTAPFHLGVNIAAAHLTDDAFTTDVLQFSSIPRCLISPGTGSHRTQPGR